MWRGGLRGWAAAPIGCCRYEYIWHGTTNLFAALNVLDGTVLARRAPRKRHTEFLASWLDLVERWFADITR
jgi:hypothetical protein